MSQRLAFCAYIKNSTFAVASAIQTSSFRTTLDPFIELHFLRIFGSHRLPCAGGEAADNSCATPRSRAAGRWLRARARGPEPWTPARPCAASSPHTAPCTGRRARVPGFGEGADPACKTPSHPPPASPTLPCVFCKALGHLLSVPHHCHPVQTLLFPPFAVSSSAMAPPTASIGQEHLLSLPPAPVCAMRTGRPFNPWTSAHHLRLLLSLRSGKGAQ